MKSITKIVLSVLGIFAVLVLIYFSNLAFNYFTAEYEGKVDAQKQISSGGNRVQEYEKFFRLCETVQNVKGNVETQERLLEDAETTKERSRLRSNIAGMEANIRKNVNEYNSMSKQYTTERFKDSSLPKRLSTNDVQFCN